MRRSRSVLGFTLVEILVALTLIALLAAAITPAIIGQIRRGESNRIMEDMIAAGDAAKLFRADVNRWPGELGQLTTQPSGGDPSVEGTIPGGLVNRWSGPYLERPVTNESIPTAAGAAITALSTTSWGGNDYFTVIVTGVSERHAQDISVSIDGNDAVVNDDTGGQVRLDGSTLRFLASLLQ